MGKVRQWSYWPAQVVERATIQPKMQDELVGEATPRNRTARFFYGGCPVLDDDSDVAVVNADNLVDSFASCLWPVTDADLPQVLNTFEAVVMHIWKYTDSYGQMTHANAKMDVAQVKRAAARFGLGKRHGWTPPTKPLREGECVVIDASDRHETPRTKTKAQGTQGQTFRIRSKVGKARNAQCCTLRKRVIIEGQVLDEGDALKAAQRPVARFG